MQWVIIASHAISNLQLWLQKKSTVDINLKVGTESIDMLVLQEERNQPAMLLWNFSAFVMKRFINASPSEICKERIGFKSR